MVTTSSNISATKWQKGGVIVKSRRLFMSLFEHGFCQSEFINIVIRFIPPKLFLDVSKRLILQLSTILRETEVVKSEIRLSA